MKEIVQYRSYQFFIGLLIALCLITNSYVLESVRCPYLRRLEEQKARAQQATTNSNEAQSLQNADPHRREMLPKAKRARRYHGKRADRLKNGKIKRRKVFGKGGQSIYVDFSKAITKN